MFKLSRSTKVLLQRLLSFSKRVIKHFVKNKGMLLASAVGYNALLSIIPLFAVLLVVLSQFLDQQLLLDAVSNQVEVLLPGKSDAITGVLTEFLEGRQVAGGIGLIALVVFSSIAFRMLEEAMSVIFRHHQWRHERRSFLVSALMPLLYIGSIGLALLLVTVIVAVLGSITGDSIRFLGFEISFEATSKTFLRCCAVLGLVALFTSFYRLMPVVKVRTKLAVIGGVVATILWEIVRFILTWYFENLSLVSVVYGSLATMIVILLSMEIAAIIVLLGAQVIAELEKSDDAGFKWYEEPPDGPLATQAPAETSPIPT